MIKYIGSKRRLVPVLARICQASGARTALDLFTGTTRVAQAFKARACTSPPSTVPAMRTPSPVATSRPTPAPPIPALAAAVTHLNALPASPAT